MEKHTKEETKKTNTTSEPDPETVGKTDPQEHMKGPISSIMQKLKDQTEKNDDNDREELKHPTAKTIEDPFDSHRDLTLPKK